MASGSPNTSARGFMRESRMRALRRCKQTERLRRMGAPAALAVSLARLPHALETRANASSERSPQVPNTSTTIGTRTRPASLHCIPNFLSFTITSYCAAAAPPHTLAR